jgi:hypothetical protein
MDHTQPTNTDLTRDEQEGYRYLLPTRGGWIGAKLGCHCTLEITPFRLRVSESLGPFHRDTQHAWDHDSVFEVAEHTEHTRGHVLNGLRMTSAQGESWLTLGYPEEKLEQLCGHLRAAQLEWKERVPPPIGSEPEAPAMPSRSEVQIHTTADGVHVDIPPMGLMRGSHGLWLIGTIFLSGSTAALLAFMFGILPAPAVGEIAILGLFLLLFGGFGALLMVSGWHLGRRSATSASLSSVRALATSRASRSPASNVVPAVWSSMANRSTSCKSTCEGAKPWA